jgi:CheY-like chemotaxis protein
VPEAVVLVVDDEPLLLEMLCDMLADLGCEAVCVDCPVKGLKKIADRWVHETKFDGYRSQLHLRAGKPAVYTRSGLNWTPKFAPIAAAAVDPPANRAIMDGQMGRSGRQGLHCLSNSPGGRS